MSVNTKNKRVFVGMSGGVDSSVSAALLKKAGYDVTGVFIKVWQPDWLECTWKEDRRDAMRVAAHLEIPFITLDLEKEYKKGVVDYMISEYQAGRTPNPDVMCNKTVKFGAFYEWAMKNSADYVATGHYARVAEDSGIKQDPNNTFKLLTSVDASKEQSYFLYTIKQEQLAHVLFPIGDLQKSEVRKLARKFKLPTAEKKDSQGLCFLGKIDTKEFLKHYIDVKAGSVLNEKGEVIGTHSGALLFTLGERHGFTITKKTPHDQAYFVVGKDIIHNTITVANKQSEINTTPKKIKITQVNWISGSVPKSSSDTFSLTAQSRYHQELQKIKILSATMQEAEIEFENPQEFLTPGQSLVLYNGQECLGGGVIS